MDVQTDRLTEIESRLARIEAALSIRREPAPAKPAPPPAPRAERRPEKPRVGATQLMAWAASFAFILAATYLVKLVYDSGWLTPDRQVGIAFFGGVALIVAGLMLGVLDRAYAAYLPAAGIAILYLTLYAGQLRYDLFDVGTVYGVVVAVTLAALWLGRRFESSAYALLAVVGSYAAPLLVAAARADLRDVVIYFTAWSLLFSFLGVLEGRRPIYVVALYCALFGFDWIFRLGDQSQWAATAAVYQLVQFVVFGATAAWYSVQHREPMTATDAVAHGLALFYFYFLEYVLLHEYLPEWAPWLALASVLAVLGLYLAARSRLGDATEASGVLVSAYCSVVTAHVVFFALLPERWLPWLALTLPLVTLALAQRVRSRAALAPVAIVSALLFALGLGMVAFSRRDDPVPMPSLALCLYAAVLYAGYWFARRRKETLSSAPLLLYVGHLAFLVATVRFFDSGLYVSISWAAFAIALLLYALRLEDRAVGQSSLVVFAASGVKVMLHDLSGSATLVRVFTLVVLAVSLYAGGWLYQKLSAGDRQYHHDSQVNDQLNLIRRLAQRGLGDVELAAELERRGVPYLGRDGAWSAETVRRLREQYSIA